MSSIQRKTRLIRNSRIVEMEAFRACAIVNFVPHRYQNDASSNDDTLQRLNPVFLAL
jgi:hypothetical protein